jgi:hypothetical protein
MRSLEAPLRRRVCRDALQLGVRALPIDTAADAGWPDRIFLTPYSPLWLEFKRPGDVPRPLQEQRLAILNNLGYSAGWVDSYDDAMEWIKKCSQRSGSRTPGR